MLLHSSFPLILLLKNIPTMPHCGAGGGHVMSRAWFPADSTTPQVYRQVLGRHGLVCALHAVSLVDPSESRPIRL